MRKLSILLLLLVMIPAIIAEDDLTEETSSQDTLTEVSSMAHNHGAEVRLLQLEKSFPLFF